MAAGLAAMGAVIAVSTLASASGAERWALRPKPPAVSEPASIEPTPALRGSRAIPISELPGERRTVRIVYQGYGPAESR